MVKRYIGLIEPYLADMINDYKSKDAWREAKKQIQLTAEINFTSLKPDSDETSLNRFYRDIKKVYKKK